MVRVSVRGPWLELTVPAAWAGRGAREALLAFGLSRRLWGQLQATAGLTLNGASLGPAARLAGGDRVGLRVRGAEAYGVEPQALPLDVLFEDEYLLVVAKPPPWPVYPTPDRAGQPSLGAAVAHHYRLAGVETTVRPVHRLDVGTSGLVLYAKDGLTHALLDQALVRGEIRRHYLGLALGIFKWVAASLTYPIGDDRHHATRRRVSPSGQPAVTHVRVLQQAEQAALLNLELETGRTHQIRVHLSHIGHPLLGDTLYGAPAQPAFGRPALHAAELELKHPYSGELLRLRAPLPADLLRLCDALGVARP